MLTTLVVTLANDALDAVGSSWRLTRNARPEPGQLPVKPVRVIRLPGRPVYPQMTERAS